MRTIYLSIPFVLGLALGALLFATPSAADSAKHYSQQSRAQLAKDCHRRDGKDFYRASDVSGFKLG